MSFLAQAHNLEISLKTQIKTN